MTTDDEWAEYARLQETADSKVLDSRAWAIEEALDAILDKIEASEPITSGQVDNLVVNRGAKHRQRCSLLDQNAAVFGFNGIADEEGRLLARCRLFECYARCTGLEWRVLTSIGMGYTYGAVAHQHGIPESTAKTWVRRVRLRLAA